MAIVHHIQFSLTFFFVQSSVYHRVNFIDSFCSHWFSYCGSKQNKRLLTTTTMTTASPKNKKTSVCCKNDERDERLLCLCEYWARTTDSRSHIVRPHHKLENWRLFFRCPFSHFYQKEKSTIKLRRGERKKRLSRPFIGIMFTRCESSVHRIKRKNRRTIIFLTK